MWDNSSVCLSESKFYGRDPLPKMFEVWEQNPVMADLFMIDCCCVGLAAITPADLERWQTDWPGMKEGMTSAALVAAMNQATAHVLRLVSFAAETQYLPIDRSITNRLTHNFVQYPYSPLGMIHKAVAETLIAVGDGGYKPKDYPLSMPTLVYRAAVEGWRVGTVHENKGVGLTDALYRLYTNSVGPVGVDFRRAWVTRDVSQTATKMAAEGDFGNPARQRLVTHLVAAGFPSGFTDHVLTDPHFMRSDWVMHNVLQPDRKTDNG